MTENKWSDDAACEELSEEKKQEMVWNRYFPQMRFWSCCNLLEILFLLVAPFLIYSINKMLDPRHKQYLYHYETSQLFLFLIILAVSLAGVFFIFTAKDKSRLDKVKWLSLAGAVMICLSCFLFRKSVGHASDNEAKLYWCILICSLLHIVSCIKISLAYKNL